MGVQGKARMQLASAMAIFGTVGIFVRYIPLPSSVIALVRGIIGTLFLLLLTVCRRRRIKLPGDRRTLLLLCGSGACIGINWILLFEAYRYTTVATATLCYYMAPIFVILLSPLVLGERLTPKKLLCVAAALVGAVLVSGAVESGVPTLADARGILLGLGATAFYACVILLNKCTGGIAPYDRTILQLAIAAVVLLPYTLVTVPVADLRCPPLGLLLLLFVGTVHTGISYGLFFGSITALPAQTAALFTYVDPVVAILLSALFLGEPLTVWSVVGAVLILGAALISDLNR